MGRREHSQQQSMGILFCSDSVSEVFTSTFYFESTDWNYSFWCSLSGVRLQSVEQHRDCVCVCARASCHVNVQRERESERASVFCVFFDLPIKSWKTVPSQSGRWTDEHCSLSHRCCVDFDADNLDTFFFSFSKGLFLSAFMKNE